MKYSERNYLFKPFTSPLLTNVRVLHRIYYTLFDSCVFTLVTYTNTLCMCSVIHNKTEIKILTQIQLLEVHIYKTVHNSPVPLTVCVFR